MKIKTSELTGQALGWAVAMAMGYKGVQITDYGDGKEECFFRPGVELLEGKLIVGSGGRWKPQSEWSQGGPIMDHLIMKGMLVQRADTNKTECRATMDKWESTVYGETPLIAALRCYVIATLGNEVEIPANLAAATPATIPTPETYGGMSL